MNFPKIFTAEHCLVTMIEKWPKTLDKHGQK